MTAYWELANCVAEVSWSMAGVMFAGLLAGTFALGRKILPGWYWGRR